MKRHRTKIIPRMNNHEWFETQYPLRVFITRGTTIYEGQQWMHENAPGVSFSAGFDKNRTYFQFQDEDRTTAAAFRMMFGAAVEA